jgi:hypothetical protein
LWKEIWSVRTLFTSGTEGLMLVTSSSKINLEPEDHQILSTQKIATSTRKNPENLTRDFSGDFWRNLINELVSFVRKKFLGKNFSCGKNAHKFWGTLFFPFFQRLPLLSL